MIDTRIMSGCTHKENLAREVARWINNNNIDVISVSYAFEPDKMCGWYAFITYRENEETKVEK